MDAGSLESNESTQNASVSARVPTSELLETLARDAPAEGATLAWVTGRLGERSFGIIMLLVALIGLLPGTSGFVGILLTIPAAQMILAHNAPVLPRRIANRRISTPRLVKLFGRTARFLRRMERIVKPRWRTPFEATKRVIGAVILLLGLTLLAPIPFSHIIPALVIMSLAFAFLEEDGVLLAISLVAAIFSIAITAAAVWGTVEVGLLI